jgi:hypothetical protein
MSLWDGLAHATAQALADSLNEEQRQRGTALIVAKSAKPDADASDLMIMANYVVTGFEIIPEPKDDPYPHASGDVTVLGPQVFASTPQPRGGTTINWQGMNFILQVDEVAEDWHVELGGQRFTQAQWEAMLAWRAGTDMPLTEHPDDPGPEEPSGELPEIDPAEPAPMAGAHWQGHRGGQPG